MCDAPTDKIKNAQLLLDHFGEWPCFHDSEIKYIHLDRGNIDVFEMPTMDVAFVLVDWKRVNENKEWKMNLQVSLRFTASEFENIEGFNHQNVITELFINDIDPTANEVDRFEVEMQDAFGVYSKFKCREIEVISFEKTEENIGIGA